MIIGLSIPTFTALHVAISLIGILTGLIAVPAFAAGKRVPGWTAVFLGTTLLTNLTGFLFPIGGFTPALAVGAISTVLLIIAIAALYGFGLKGKAGILYAITATAALWFNLFVLVVQSFLKVPALHALAPTGAEPPFFAAQGTVLIAMLLLGWAAVRSVRKIRVASAI
jgi:hypothetical protein